MQAIAWPTVQSGGTAMNSVCIRRPAEFSGYSRLRSSATRSDGGSFSRISSLSSSSRPSSNSTASSDSSSRTPSATVSGSSSSRISSRTASSTSFSAEKPKSAIVRRQLGDQIAEIGLVQFGNDCAQKRRLRGADRTRDFVDEFFADFAMFVAQRETIEYGRFGGVGNFGIFGHAALRRFDRIVQLVCVVGSGITQ